MTTRVPEDLSALGWSVLPWDTCWLECDKNGFCRQVNGKVICLCPEHARLLEAGRFDGDYSGAPLPEFTAMATWPWTDPATMDGDVPLDAVLSDPVPPPMGTPGQAE